MCLPEYKSDSSSGRIGLRATMAVLSAWGLPTACQEAGVACPGRAAPFATTGGRPKHKIAAVPHGFRSSFLDWAAEETDHPREVIEAALAHVVQNRVEAAYRRTDLFERRPRLMID